jgi:hypothetical protein
MTIISRTKRIFCGLARIRMIDDYAPQVQAMQSDCKTILTAAQFRRHRAWQNGRKREALLAVAGQAEWQREGHLFPPSPYW